MFAWKLFWDCLNHEEMLFLRRVCTWCHMRACNCTALGSKTVLADLVLIFVWVVCSHGSKGIGDFPEGAPKDSCPPQVITRQQLWKPFSEGSKLQAGSRTHLHIWPRSFHSEPFSLGATADIVCNCSCGS